MLNMLYDVILLEPFISFYCYYVIYDSALVLSLSQIRYSLVVILELNGVSEVQYKGVMMIDVGKYQ